MQRKPEMLNQDPRKNDKSLKNFTKQPRYWPQGRTAPIVSMSKDKKGDGATSDVAEKLGNVTIGECSEYVGQILPPPMKAGVQWTAEYKDMFLRPTQQIQSGTRKVAG
ncbi:uncharacterized protein LOC120199164 [Hibiscus syriacus]|uniref:uncharacterized protein LOC120199164 n=1 Tax=Hibiscus syriacus TaxID=106335 RepID=UPI0019230DC2|nr:uncharacterized protein LOC120199164 [Hibiscus syriacus]